MIEKTKKNKKGSISEEDVSTLFRRYTATTVLALLQEVAQFEGVKIDWNALVKKTKTGISNPREYQMLWRHLAYRHVLLDKLDEGTQPVDDDSDLEYEVEAFPEVSSEASAEAAACVKVMVASGIPSDSSHANNSTVEAPLTINVPNGQPSRASSENFQSTVQGMNITVPVSVQKQALPAVTSFEGSDTNVTTGGTIPVRRKRKPWSTTEDLELMAAVKKFGEGNWVNILKGEFKGDRTASQLSQRWAIIRKRQNNLKLETTSSGVQLSEAQQAARHAMNLALDPPKNLITNSTGGTMLSTPSNSMPLTSVAESSTLQYRQQNHSSSKFSSMASTSATKTNDEVSRDPSSSAANGGTLINGTTTNPVSPTAAAEDSLAPHQSQQCPIVTKSCPVEEVGAAAKSQLKFEKPSTKPDCSSDPVRAASVAAGVRIATQSDAASLSKTAHVKNTVHLMPTGGSSTISSMSEVAASRVSNHTAVLSSSSHAVSAKTSSTSSLSLPVSSKQITDEVRGKQGVKPAEACKYAGPEVAAKGEGKDYVACVFRDEPTERVKEDEDGLLDQQVDFTNQPAVADSCNSSTTLEVANSELSHVNGNKGKGSLNAKDDRTCDSAVEKGEDHFFFQANCGNEGMDGKQTMPSTVTDLHSNNRIAVSTLEVDNGSSL